MKALIVEDELMAQLQLKRLLGESFPDIEVVACADSVAQTVEYLEGGPSIDMIFMDVELSDGDCFEIYRRCSIDVPVIMTTAYDSYAVKAFETGGIDYLLKPIEPEALKRAVTRVRLRRAQGVPVAAPGPDPGQAYRERLTVKIGNRLLPVPCSDMAFITSEDKYNYLTLLTGEKYLVDFTLDVLADQLPPDMFFKVSRGGIVSRKAILEVVRRGGRLILRCLPEKEGLRPFSDRWNNLTVARARVKPVLAWLG